ncbi:hypothetical protein HOY80DRAFT_31329 [Tuber brumale]|nr:hypothetical protein HOY80DRAFT_31329 [Tuber brumale]
MQRTCLACVEHARHVQNMLGMLTSFHPHPFPYPLLYRLFAVCIRFAVRCAPSARRFIVRPFPITVSYFPSPGATYRSPICSHTLYRSLFLVRGSLFAVPHLPAAAFCLPAAVRSRSLVVRRCAIVVGGGGAGAGAVGNGDDRKAARQRESLWDLHLFC